MRIENLLQLYLHTFIIQQHRVNYLNIFWLDLLNITYLVLLPIRGIIKMVVIPVKNIDAALLGDFSAVFSDSPSPKRPFQHYHDSCEICFYIKVNEVKLENFIKDTKYEIHDGDIIFINQLDIHSSVYHNADATYQRYIINFTRQFIYNHLKSAGIEYILRELETSQYHTGTSLKTRNKLEPLFKAIVLAQEQKISTTYTKQIKNATIESYLTLILIKVHSLITTFKPESRISKRDQLVRDMIQFIDYNYASDINLNLLSEEFYRDKYHLSHTFKEISGFSIMEYVQHRRIIEAQKMLRKDPDKKIIDTCFDCGFNNQQHFYRIFKKISGITPDKYRKL